MPHRHIQTVACSLFMKQNADIQKDMAQGKSTTTPQSLEVQVATNQGFQMRYCIIPYHKGILEIQKVIVATFRFFNIYLMKTNIFFRRSTLTFCISRTTCGTKPNNTLFKCSDMWLLGA